MNEKLRILEWMSRKCHRIEVNTFEYGWEPGWQIASILDGKRAIIAMHPIDEENGVPLYSELSLLEVSTDDIRNAKA